MAYATRTDLAGYVPMALSEIWANDTTACDDSLDRAYRKINEWLGGLDRFEDGDIPIAAQDDGSYPEVLIELNVYMAIWLRISGTHAGEIFDDTWQWVQVHIRNAKRDIEGGKFRWDADPDASSTGSKLLGLTRSSP